MGNRTGVSASDGSHAYGYDFDHQDRLLAADHPGNGYDEAYTYDPIGNRLTSAQHPDWAYDPQNDELDGYDCVSYAYDANGNRATRTDAAGTTTYAYDFENRLVRVDLPGGAWGTYDYDASGRRVRRNDGGIVTLWWYEGEDIVLETDQAGTEIARWTHGPGIDEPLKFRRNGVSYFYHEDALGSIVMLTDSSKKSKRTYTYDAFGNIVGGSGSVENFYTYTGRELDEELNLYYYRARHYDPKVGRFLQTDPLPPRPEEMNRYAYVANNPYNLIDPTGKACGSFSSDPFLTDKPGGFDFSDCCQGHDDCYGGECGEDKTKESCDDGFYNCMIKKRDIKFELRQ